MWTAYGYWLPNDPRGSTSKRIACDVIAELGELHFGRKKVQPASREIRKFYEKAEDVLKFPLRELSKLDMVHCVSAIGKVVVENKYTCYACAVMPDHVHILIRKHKHQAEEMIENLKRAARLALSESWGIPEHPVWGTGGWKVFLDEPDDIWRTIRYVENNPVKMRSPMQRWDFVKPYDNWPLHKGYNPNSPYAKRIGNQHA
jgi:REP element-mobilizing transposase RayT